jgi:hypothetical protein
MTSVEAEGSISEGPATSLQVRRCQDGTVTWAATIPVATADLEGFVAAIELAKQVDDRIAQTFPKRRPPRPRDSF